MKLRIHPLAAAISVSLLCAASPSIAGDLRTNSNPVAGQYIVVLKPQAASLVGESSRTARVAVVAKAMASQHQVKLLHSYERVLRGFAVKADHHALATLLADPRVDYIEEDGMVTANAITTQDGATWGIDRVDRRLLPLDTKYTYNSAIETGAGVHVYVIDSGLNLTHDEFAGRVGAGADFIGGGVSDCNGHGTHVAGTIGGTTYGIAKAVTVHPVRVFGCGPSSNWTTIIAGIDWVALNKISPAVANMSLGGFASVQTLAVETATQNLHDSGVTVVVSAGNFGMDACNFVPARVPEAITVGSTDSTDTRSGFSNYGSCLDMFAPGSGITSAWFGSTAATATKDGTSMAAPHVAGVAARYLQVHPTDSPTQVLNAIQHANNIFGSTAGWPGVTNPGLGSPNKLLHYGALDEGYNDGDPHIKTVNGLNYDFQTGGEFVALRSQSMQIQTRQRPVDSFPWVSVNTAVAARVGKFRVTWQPGNGVAPDPAGLQLRIDGVITSLPPSGIDLELGARIAPVGTNGISIDFPDGTTMTATASWWPYGNVWYMNVRAYHTMATEGIMGALKKDEWLRAGFADKWRVTSKTSLFDYARGVTTKNFVSPVFPPDKVPPMDPRNVALAKEVCAPIKDEKLLRDCQFDVGTTGDPVFAGKDKAMQAGSTATGILIDALRQPGKVSITAKVRSHANRDLAPAGAIRLLIDGQAYGDLIPLDANGHAQWVGALQLISNRHVAAEYVPASGSTLLGSQSGAMHFTQARP